jgi:hypothetical protein
LYAEQVVPLAECSTIEIPGVFRADKWNPTANQAKLTTAPIINNILTKNGRKIQ